MSITCTYTSTLALVITIATLFAQADTTATKVPCPAIPAAVPLGEGPLGWVVTTEEAYRLARNVLEGHETPDTTWRGPEQTKACV